MISEYYAKSYCKEDISLIENYDKAIADTTQLWHCHHRRETIYSRSGLIEIGEYYNRPACELIFLTPNEHHRLHTLGKNLSEEIRKKMSESLKGRTFSAETRKKISEKLKGEKCYIFGKHHSEETRKKISESNKGEKNPFFGKSLSEETRKKLSEAHKGKNHSAEARKKMSDVHKGKHWWNDGVSCKHAKECPGPEWKPGRILKP